MTAERLNNVSKVTCRGIDVLVRTEKAGDLNVLREVIADEMYGLPQFRSFPVRTILDVGAHIGCFALWAKQLWPQARVIAAEPNPRSCELLRLNLERFPDADVHEVAVRYDGADILTDSEGATGGGFVASAQEASGLLAPNARDRV